MIGSYPQAWFAPFALLPDGLARDVRIEVDGPTIVRVMPGSSSHGATVLDGVLLPGFANTHSHAFHRALRGRTHADGGSFWTWREAMYAVAARLDPESYYRLGRAVYAEMALAGWTTVGEFHYLHHAPGGEPYSDPNAMGRALIAAARDAGVRLTLLDACYLSADVAGAHLAGTQLRFGDASVQRWAERLRTLIDGTPVGTTRIGAAIHSVRAVPAEALPAVVRAADGLPLHVHLSEQPAENQACLAVHGCTPTELLARSGALGPLTTAVHATHLTPTDIALLGQAGAHVAFCPTTERDLADGIGPARALADAGCWLSLGSDQHAMLAPLEEARALEMHERLTSGHRGRFSPTELLSALTDHASLGWRRHGALAVDHAADFVAVRLDSPSTAGIDPAQVVMAATVADVHAVVVDGRFVVRDGIHRLGDVGRLLAEAVEPLWT